MLVELTTTLYFIMEVSIELTTIYGVVNSIDASVLIFKGSVN